MINSGVNRSGLLGSIVIRKRTSNIIYLQIFYLLVVFFLRDVVGLPSVITYLTDVLAILSIIFCIGRIQKTIKKAKSKTQIIIIAAIIFFMCFGALLNQVSPLLFIWGLRNNIRFFAFWLSCVVLLAEEDLKKIFHLLQIVFWIHLVLVLYQYLFMGKVNDTLGGIFGVVKGCNTYSNIFICIISALMIALYLHNSCSLLKLIVYLIGCLLIAALSELKIFYVELVLLFAVSMIVKKPNVKTIVIISIGVLSVVVGIMLLQRYNPDSLKFLFDSDSRDSYLSGNGYTGTGDLNRFTAISQINEMFFKNNFLYKLFGFGLGSCDISSYFASDFYLKYGYLHYLWFSHAWVYLEQGIVGLILLILFFVSIITYMYKNRKTVGKNYLFFISFMLCPIFIVNIIYNCALEVEACYFIAFICSIPFVLNKKAK